MRNMTPYFGSFKKMPRNFACLAAASFLLGGFFLSPTVGQQVSITETPPAAAQRAVTAGDRAAARRHIARGDDLGAHGSDWDVTAAEYRKALERDPTSAEAHYDLAKSLQDGKQIDACILEYQQAIRLDMPDPAGAAHNLSQTADAYRQLGSIREDKNQLISAVANFRASLKLEPDDALTHSHLAHALYSREFYDSAAAEYKSALRLDPKGSSLDLSIAYESLGNCEATLKQYPAAITDYHAAVRKTPNEYGPHYNLGLTLTSVQRYREAIREFHEAMRLKPSSASVRNGLAYALYQSGKSEEGRVEWRKVLRMGDPDAADLARENLNDGDGLVLLSR